MHILSTSCIFSAKSILGKRFEANAPFVILIKLRYQLNIQHLHVHNFTHPFVRIIWKRYKLLLKKMGEINFYLITSQHVLATLFMVWVYSDLCWDRIHENYRKFKEKQLLAVKDQNIHTLAKLKVGMIEKNNQEKFPNLKNGIKQLSLYPTCIYTNFVYMFAIGIHNQYFVMC